MNTTRVIIIGGGVGGLAAAIRLACAGCSVSLFEKNQRVGGKLHLWTAAHPNRPDDRPFRFDTGPSLLTLPFVFDDLFRVAGKDLKGSLSIQPLDPIARFTWADGQRFELAADRATRLENVRRFAPGDVEGFDRFLRRGEEIWNRAGEMFLFNSPEQLMNAPGRTPLDGLKMLAVPFQIGMFQRYRVMVDRHVRHPRLREVLYQYATYSGASPFKAPATLGVIPFAEMHFGGWYVEGGMYRLAEALEQLAGEAGATIRTGVAVERILVERAGTARRVRGVRLADGTEVEADVVLCNSDVVYSYRSLIDPEHRPHFADAKLDRLEPGGSGMVLLLGVEGTYPQLAHHTKFMPEDYRSDLRAMFETLSVPADPCLYVCATTRTDPSQAPAGCENLFVLCSAPPLTAKLDWAIEGRRYREQVVRTLEERFGLEGLSRRIVVERTITPRELQSLYNANAGSIYGISSNSLRTAFLRPPNRDKQISGLYFAGGATHPGGGLPLVALSGKIASELILEDVGQPQMAQTTQMKTG
jgi:phytoene desaturase